LPAWLPRLWLSHRFGQQARRRKGGTARKRRLSGSVMASVWATDRQLSFEERCKILARIGFNGR
jgi:hypothetical protein